MLQVRTRPDFCETTSPEVSSTAEMLHHRRQRHGERALEFADRRRPLGEPLDNRPAGRIGKSLKRQVERGLIVKHRLNYQASDRKARALVSNPGLAPFCRFVLTNPHLGRVLSLRRQIIAEKQNLFYARPMTDPARLMPNPDTLLRDRFDATKSDTKIFSRLYPRNPLISLVSDERIQGNPRKSNT